MNMNWKGKRYLHLAVIMILAGWAGLFCPARASQLYFPCYADFRPQFDVAEIGYILCHKKKETVGKGEKTEKDLISSEDKEVLYKVVSMECDTGYEGSLAVISCMLNRQASGKYPDDLMDVVREDSQFTAYYDKETETYPYLDRIPSKECIQAVDDALERGKRNIPSYIYYFRSSDYEYLHGYITYGQIGDNTYFYQYEDTK